MTDVTLATVCEASAFSAQLEHWANQAPLGIQSHVFKVGASGQGVRETAQAVKT